MEAKFKTTIIVSKTRLGQAKTAEGRNEKDIEEKTKIENMVEKIRVLNERKKTEDKCNTKHQNTRRENVENANKDERQNKVGPLIRYSMRRNNERMDEECLDSNEWMRLLK